VLALLATSFLIVFGCGKGSDVSTGPTPAGTVVVTGEVVEVQNLVPVDGGVTIEITLEGGKTERLLFPSLFTSPPPTEEMLSLYSVVRRVEIGDLVRAQGKRTSAGIELEALAILAGRR
jgi:hypothetical protein